MATIFAPLVMLGCAATTTSGAKQEYRFPGTVQFQGDAAAGKFDPNEDVAVYRVGRPDRPCADLGFLAVRCPTMSETDAMHMSTEVVGGCSYAQALYAAGRRAASVGGQALYGVETSVAGNGNVVSLTATTCRYVDGEANKVRPRTAPAPVAAPIAPAASGASSVEERLRKLQKLRDDKLITPEDFERRKAEILKEI